MGKGNYEALWMSTIYAVIELLFPVATNTFED